MPKRSLNPGNGGQNNAGQKKIQQLNQAVDAMLSRANSKPGKVEGESRTSRTHRGGLAQSAECKFQGTIEIRIERKEAYVYRS